MGFPFKVIGKLQKDGAGKRRFFLAPRLAALVSLSTVFLASSAVIYASAVPDLMYRSPAVSAAVTAAQEAEAAISEGFSSVFSSPNTAQASADAPAAVETAVSAVDPAEASQPSSAAAEQTQGSEGLSLNSSSANHGSASDEVVVEDDSLSESEEQQWRSYYIALYNNLTDCVSRYNECSSELGSLANASEPERQRAAKRCDVLSSDLLDGYLKACNSGIPSSSRYASFSDSQTGAYRSLASALACIQEAWEVNLASEDPASCTAKMNEKLAPQEARLAEFNAYYAKSCPA